MTSIDPAGGDEAEPTDAMIFESAEPMDLLAEAEESQAHNRAKVGAARPSALLYTYGVGSIMDLPQFSIMPAGLDDWEPIWRRRQTVPLIDEPRLLDVVQKHLGRSVRQLRDFPWQPKRVAQSQEGSDLGVPARVFPQWLRCTGCDYLGPLPRFTYTNTHPYRSDLAAFTHESCPGRGSGGRRRSAAVPARHLLACVDGHLDEFPYLLWVHRGEDCPAAPLPDLQLLDSNLGQGAGAVVVCTRCRERRGVGEAQGEVGRRKLPACRGRHPHLDAFDQACGLPTRLIMMGAANLWFAATQSVIVMPRTAQEDQSALVAAIRAHVTPDRIAKYSDDPDYFRDVLVGKHDLAEVSDDQLRSAVSNALEPGPSEEERHAELREWDPIELRLPEWDYLQKPVLFPQQDNTSGLMVTEMPRGQSLRRQLTRVIAVNRMKKVNAFMGFTRIDEMDRVGDLPTRLVKLTRGRRPTWVPATEDRGEGVFVQLDEEAVAVWEQRIRPTGLWAAHCAAHELNFRKRFSESAAQVDPGTRLPPPRYWLVHTFAHILIREMAMSCGYGAASLSERLYAWSAAPGRPAAAGLLICTTASDSEGTLGGLVALSDPERLEELVDDALRRAARCSSDPVCGQRTPRHGEDFLHGAACHCCCFASETSCERANRFLDRRFLLTLPTIEDERVPGFFSAHDAV
ncbi:DUF1998 domain-containing protein [Cryptosporangium japonicum]|uniref:DUF1998 domain-containing protein n=1 Tax=Cryptosporangium japonicum TaxID=80872 RepID=A0ABN0UXY3_9ACTN